MKERVVVTGMGIVSPIGRSVPAFEQSLRAGRCGIGHLSPEVAEHIPVRIGAELRGLDLAAELEALSPLPPGYRERALRCARRSTLSIQASLLAALQGWADAGLFDGGAAPERTALIVAGSNLSQSLQFALHGMFQTSPEYLNPTYALHFMDTDHVGALSEVLGIRGEGFTVGGASASGNLAVIKGLQLLRLGGADICLVVGAVADLSPIELMAFHNLGVIGGKAFGDQPQKACRPFDARHEGFIYGQAAGCLVLESASSAARRGARAQAELLSGAVVLDGNRSPDPDETGEARAMERALVEAGLAPEAVDYLNAHGTSTPAGDRAELRAVRAVFGDHTANLWLNSTKGLTGHCLWSAGVVEAIATIVQLRGGFVHPNPNLEEPVEQGFRFAGPQAADAAIATAMSNSFGFGGLNTSIILKKG